MCKAVEKLVSRWRDSNSLLCVGLDPQFDRLPEEFKRVENPLFEFNKSIIEQTHEFVSAYKPNMAFYEARGEQGWSEVRLTVEYLQTNHPEIFTICDAKRGDIGSTNEQYAKAVFDDLGFDAITLHPYTGREGSAPFLERSDKVSIILCKTSNPGSGEFQDLMVEGRPLWHQVAENVAQNWNKNNNCMLVVGATYPEQIRQVRQIVGDMTLLVPGVGAQGGDLVASVKAGVNSQKMGLMISNSREVIYAESPRDKSEELRDAIRTAI